MVNVMTIVHYLVVKVVREVVGKLVIIIVKIDAIILAKEEIISRRELFKNAAKKGGFFLSICALFTITPLMNAYNVKCGCFGACNYWCANHCSNDCTYSCTGKCTSCKGNCQGDCTRNCFETCQGSCKSSCKGSCENTCAGSLKI